MKPAWIKPLLSIWLLGFTVNVHCLFPQEDLDQLPQETLSYTILEEPELFTLVGNVKSDGNLGERYTL